MTATRTTNGQRHFRTPGGVIAVYANGGKFGLCLNHYPMTPGSEIGYRCIEGQEAHIVAHAVACGDMPEYVFADWLEERGLPATAAMIRHPDTTE